MLKLNAYVVIVVCMFSVLSG
ncbi:MAG: hypothetical protein H6Q53_1865, partial [Deltaproteobacteria bacterium]|nr:hypothetical protein [Deltaproteobacteria bacterium]